MDIDQLLSLKGRRVGFQMTETMLGTHRFVKDFSGEQKIKAGQELPFDLTMSWGHPRLSAFLSPISGDFLSAVCDGSLTAGGIGEKVAINGTVDFCYFSQAMIRYTFDFEVGEQLYRYVGEKRAIRLWNLHRTHATCFGELREVASGDLVSESVVKFGWGTLPEFVGSFRLT